jgi:lipopolysaccharide assembly outer membrane protein LptD (OstA)
LLLIFFSMIPGEPAAAEFPDTLAIPVKTSSPDSLPVRIDTISGDSLVTRSDTLSPDTLVRMAKKKEALEARVDYKSEDSLRFDVKKQRMYLFSQGDITYKDINLKANYIEIDFPNNMIYAHGSKDTSGSETGLPEFTQGDMKFKSRLMNYNYKTRKGYIRRVFTQQDEGYLHGEVVKKMADDVTYMKSGSYTTCDREEHPHFEFRFSKAKVIPDNKIVTGSAYLAVAEVPTPLFIPFGYFPNKKGRRSGIILPTYGESANRGFFLENGGYYWAISQYMDLKILGDIYSRGSWAIKPTFNYVKRYKYNGMIRFGYALNKLGFPDSPDYDKRKDFEFRWVHNQDRKARPNSSFSANVNIVSNSYNRYNPSSSTQSYLSNTFQSSVNYSVSFAGKYFLDLNFNHSQNTNTHEINIGFPQVSFYVNQFYPFRKQLRAGRLKWYEQIGLKYNLDIENRYNTYDSLLFQPGWTREMQNGIRHSIPISGTWRIFKFINFTNNISLRDRMYFSYINMAWINETITGQDTIAAHYQTDTLWGFKNAFDFNLSSSINTRLYGMFQFKSGPVLAIRHVFTPAISFNYTPDFGAPGWGYVKTAANDTSANPRKYSIFQGSLYGGPPMDESGLVSFSLSNNLEMKVRNRKDTLTGTKKIVLIDNFVISASYDIARDSLNWSPLSLSGRTYIVKGLSIQYSSRWDPYALDSLGRRTNTSEWKKNRRLFRLDNTTWDIGFTYSLSSDKVKKKKIPTKGTEQEQEDLERYYDYYIDFDIPWSFSFNYNFRYSKSMDYSQMVRIPKLIQTLSFNGQLNITPKWKITLTTGWDFTNGQLAYTSIDVYRDLHCWELRFGWIPKGAMQSWNFSINVKASVLQDLKLNKKKDFRDYYD